MIDVVIVNWQSGGDLGRCVAALAASGDAALIDRIVIVDNGSSDGSADLPPASGPKFIIDRAGRNLGFAAAANRGALQGSAETILFLNPDTEIRDGGLTAALAAFVPGIGLVGLRQLDSSGRTRPSCSRFPRPSAFWLRALGLDRLTAFAAWAPFMIDWGHDNSRCVDQLMGACLFIRRTLFERLQGFDERFFLYYEDVDLALRARDLGEASWHEASGAVLHRGGGSSMSVPARRLSLSLASRLVYARKHFGPAGFASVVLCTLLVEPWARLLFAGLRQGWRGAGAVIAGYAFLLRPDAARPRLL
jgi:N-acetylglucosaminyl-diphospho-decaprenol L-rhamnosyltransferase